jgi:hypothetical protein
MIAMEVNVYLKAVDKGTEEEVTEGVFVLMCLLAYPS